MKIPKTHLKKISKYSLEENTELNSKGIANYIDLKIPKILPKYLLRDLSKELSREMTNELQKDLTHKFPEKNWQIIRISKEFNNKNFQKQMSRHQ